MFGHGCWQRLVLHRTFSFVEDVVRGSIGSICTACLTLLPLTARMAVALPSPVGTLSITPWECIFWSHSHAVVFGTPHRLAQAAFDNFMLSSSPATLSRTTSRSASSYVNFRRCSD